MLEALVALFVEVDDLAQADRCFDHLTRLKPDDFSAWTSRAAVAFTRRKPEEGIAFLRKAAEVDKPRLRRVLDRDNVVRVLEREGCTNLVRELEQLIAPPKK
jgi:hypothetical protein